MSLCPCGSGAEQSTCCEPIIHGQISAPTAESLMRARYTAHALGAFDFLESSMHSSTRERVDVQKMSQWAEAVTWQGMDVHSTSEGKEGDEQGSVDFSAKYSVNGIEQELRENASFVRENGEWRYLDGDVEGHTPFRREAPKVGRNDPCPCGSGKKYKKCCG